MTTNHYRAFPVALALTTLVLALLTLYAGSVSVARAGVWAQITCSYNGEPAPIEGWSRLELRKYDEENTLDYCWQPGGELDAFDHIGENREGGSGSAWKWEAPAGSTIAGGSVTYSMLAPRGEAYISTPEDSPSNALVECEPRFCSTPYTGTTPITRTGGTTLYAAAVCVPEDGELACPHTGEPLLSEVNITQAQFLLDDNAHPTATSVGGALLRTPASGTANLTLEAHDANGPGVFDVTVEIDGRKVWSATPDTNGGQCVSHGTVEGARAFFASQPCPQNVAVSAEIPTTGIADGEHALTIGVEDAAGNTANVYTGTINVNNHPPTSTVLVTPPPDRGACNGSPCDESATLSREAKEPLTITTTLSKSRQVLTGHLRDHAGAPIRNAQVQLLEQVQDSGATFTHLATVTTTANGSWRLPVPAGPSRVLRVAYYSHLLDAVPAATLDFHQRVKATVSLHAPRRARLGQRFTFTGSLAGGHVPAGGESVQLEIYYVRHWRTIAVVPTNARGKWSYRYSFALEPGRSWKFMAVTLPNGGYPFLSNSSQPRRVAVLP